tara:strand:- start:91 stop:660 length:570 start_codon:yes stop_codon:yes gene_type:complete
MQLKNKIALIDFDKTLIKVDSLGQIFLKEKLYFNNKLFIYGSLLFFCKCLPKNKQLFIRSLFKKNLLKKIKLLSEKKLDDYISNFKEKLNRDLVKGIKSENYDLIYVLSASEESIIEKVLDGELKVDAIISNKINQLSKNFRTCWGEEKLHRLKALIEIEKVKEIHVYTDSNDDKPLLDIATKEIILKY